jgi:hypothetical protein
MQRKREEIIVSFDAAGQLLTIKYSAFVKYLIKNGNTHCAYPAISVG